MLRRTKGVRTDKKQAFRQHVVNNQKSYAATVGQNTHAAQNKSDVFIHSRAANKIRSKCHTNSPTTGLLLKSKTEQARSGI